VIAGATTAAAGGAALWHLHAQNRALEQRLRREEAGRASREGRHAEAAAVLGDILRKAPRDVDIAYLRARESDLAGDYNAAREGYLQTLALSPRHADARAALISLTARAGAHAEALHHLARLEELVGPKDPRVAMWRARLGPPKE
jgi:Flp pilus assembly protein TadD